MMDRLSRTLLRPMVVLVAAFFACSIVSTSAADADEGPVAVTVTSNGSIVVARTDPDEVLVFAPGAHGDAAPARVISGYRTDVDAPRLVATDAAGHIYVLAHHDNCDSIAQFAADADGDAAPLTELSGPHTGLCAGIAAMTVDFSGGIYIAQRDGDEVDYFSPGSDGDVAPVDLISGVVHAELHGVNALAVGSNGGLLVADKRMKTDSDVYADPSGSITLGADVHYPPDIRSFEPAARGDADPTAIIDALVWAIASTDARVFAVTDADGVPAPAIDVWTMDGAHQGTIGGEQTTLVAPIGLAGATQSRLVVLDDRCRLESYTVTDAALLVFSAADVADVKPLVTITGSKTQLHCP